MNPVLVLASISFSISLAVGQLLFKLAADDMRAKLPNSLPAALFSPWLVASLGLYAASTALWLWILAQTQLSRAYPFALLGAGIVPLLSAIFLKEQITPGYLLGAALILAGLIVVQYAH